MERRTKESLVITIAGAVLIIVLAWSLVPPPPPFTSLWTAAFPTRAYYPGGAIWPESLGYAVSPSGDLLYVLQKDNASVFETGAPMLCATPFGIAAIYLANGSVAWTSEIVTMEGGGCYPPQMFVVNGSVFLAAFAYGVSGGPAYDYASDSLVVLEFDGQSGVRASTEALTVSVSPQAAVVSSFIIADGGHITGGFVGSDGGLSIAEYGPPSRILAHIPPEGVVNDSYGTLLRGFRTSDHLVVTQRGAQMAYVFALSNWSLVWSGALPGYIAGETVVGDEFYYEAITGDRPSLVSMDLSQGIPIMSTVLSAFDEFAAYTQLPSVSLIQDGNILYGQGTVFRAISPSGAVRWTLNMTPQAANGVGISSSSTSAYVFGGGRALLTYYAVLNTSEGPELQGFAMVDATSGGVLWDRQPSTPLFPWQVVPVPYYPCAVVGDLLIMVHGEDVVCVNMSQVR